jgi:hypothetical protein
LIKMTETKMHYIPSFYKVENPYLDQDDSKRDNFWTSLVKATGIFFTISFIVFFIVNYSFIKTQLIDWRNQKQITAEYKAITTKKRDGEINEDNQRKK